MKAEAPFEDLRTKKKSPVQNRREQLIQRRDNFLSEAQRDERNLKNLEERRKIELYLFEHSKPGPFRNEINNNLKNMDSHIKRFRKDIKQGNVLFSDLDDAIKSLDRYVEDKK